MLIKPVILSGGSGTRLWPLSRQMYPKQLLPLVGDQTLLQETITRLKGLADCSDKVMVVCNEEHRFLVAEQLREIDVQPDAIILEPTGRNTAPALTLAALAITANDNDAIMLVLPADHVIRDVTALHAALNSAQTLAEEDYLVTFGIVPERAETGYGYIEKGPVITNVDTCHKIAKFVEKPDEETAQAYLDSGNYLWNSGMFMMKASVWLEQINQFHNDIHATCQQAYQQGRADDDFYRVDKDTFAQCPSDSIDYAVMEKIVTQNQDTGKAAVVPLQAGWSDVGVWAALWDIGDKDPEGNVIEGDVVTVDVKDSMLISQQRLVAGVGLSNMIVVETVDAVLVAHKDRVQDVKGIVDWLKTQQREEHMNHRRVCRPWGSYEGIDRGERYQVKRITVNPGAALSLQLHHHRAEHWIVVKGTAKVTCGEDVFLVTENESTYIPIGAKHRLENTGTIPLEMIEIQSGSYLGEDDIVRFEDRYGRDKSPSKS